MDVHIDEFGTKSPCLTFFLSREVLVLSATLLAYLADRLALVGYFQDF